MATRQARIILASSLALVCLVGGVGFWWFTSGFKFFDWEAPPPGSLVARELAPDSTLVAIVRAGAIKGQYVFEVRRTALEELVASDTITVPVGYHEHIVALRWDGPGRAIAAIDHDFGAAKEFSLAP